MRLCAAGFTSSQRNPRYCDSVVGRSILTESGAPPSVDARKSFAATIGTAGGVLAFLVLEIFDLAEPFCRSRSRLVSTAQVFSLFRHHLVPCFGFFNHGETSSSVLFSGALRRET
jgi:hypothetical protein